MYLLETNNTIYTFDTLTALLDIVDYLRQTKEKFSVYEKTDSFPTTYKKVMVMSR